MNATYSGAMVLALALIGQLMAADDPHQRSIGGGMARKAWLGTVDVVTSPVELPMQVAKGYRKGRGVVGTTVHSVFGLFRGVTHTAGRLGHGAFNLALFWLPDPADNHGVGAPLDATFAWQEGEQHGLFDPTLGDGLAPYGRKLGRGLGNALAGICEIPGQTMRGSRDDHLLRGMGRGVWYFLGRECNGVVDIGLFLLPNPRDTYGSVFNERWPWYAMVDHIEEPAEYKR
jgi:putative exosortase-associated protein (TIGR04073 family)